MSDEGSAPPAAASLPVAPSAAPSDAATNEVKLTADTGSKSNGLGSSDGQGIESSMTENKDPEEKIPEVAEATVKSTAPATADSDMISPTEPSADVATDGASEAPLSTGKSKARRKSSGIPEHKSKKLNKKASKAKMSHIDAKPGEHYFIRLKGYPLWPGIICDEAMLPQTLLKTRPVTAARPDGTYRADYEEGGKNVHDRTFPVMYLFTNEFGWIPNYDLLDLNTETVMENIDEKKIRKDLLHAHTLASENHDLPYYKQVLQDFLEQRQAEADAKAAAKAAKNAGKSKKKSKATTEGEDDTEDVEMADADVPVDENEEEKPKSSKKRKATTEAEDATDTPQRTDPVKKPKIKLNATPKANGNATPKSTSKKDSSAKASKPKGKKSAQNGVEAAEQTPPEPEQTPEEKRAKKEREILFLRHKLQKGLLTRDQQPKEEEMKQMSEFISKLEGYADLEVSIIRATKINKVLKAILKLDEIPKEPEFKFKERSQSLLGKWNKILESDTPAPSNSAPTNGTSSKEVTNGDSADIEEKESKPAEIEKTTKQKADKTTATADLDTTMQDVAEKDIVNTETAPAETKPLDETAPVEAAT